MPSRTKWFAQSYDTLERNATHYGKVEEEMSHAFMPKILCACVAKNRLLRCDTMLTCDETVDHNPCHSGFAIHNKEWSSKYITETYFLGLKTL